MHECFEASGEKLAVIVVAVGTMTTATAVMPAQAQDAEPDVYELQNLERLGAYLSEDQASEVAHALSLRPEMNSVTLAETTFSLDQLGEDDSIHTTWAPTTHPNIRPIEGEMCSDREPIPGRICERRSRLG